MWMHESDDQAPNHPFYQFIQTRPVWPLSQHHWPRNARANRIRWKNVDGIADHEADRGLYLDSRLRKREMLAAIAMDGSHI